ncbi:MAG: NosD domain-containing protein [Candidatus Thorarchaeota archaeon]
MCRNNRVSLIIVSLLLILVLGSVTPAVDFYDNDLESAVPVLEPERESRIITGDPHAPIVIDGDDNFTQTALDELWDGDGSPDEPFIIENLSIDLGGNEGACILINNTRSHFIIRACELQNADVTWTIGIHLENVTDGLIINNHVHDNMHGIYVHRGSTRVTVSGNNIYSNLYQAIRVQDSTLNTVVNNTCISNQMGVYLHQSSNITVIDNICNSGNYHGILLGYSDFNIIDNNTCNGNSKNGIYLAFSNFDIVSNNTIRRNLEYGVRISDSSSNNTILSNSISDNIDYGVHCSSDTDNNLIYLNVIAYNDIANALDDGTDNHWNTTGIGNYWEDYSGTGVYLITGSAGSTDYHPFVFSDTTPPTIDHPADLEYIEDSTGHTIMWTPYDNYPSHYVIYQNGSEVTSTGWDGSYITVNVDGLSEGVFNYTIVVYDIHGNWVSDMVTVIVVQDTTPPTIDHPLDVEYIEGTTGHIITWSPSDTDPSHYVVYQNDTEMISASWDGSSITVNVDGLSIGVYECRIVVYDTSGNWVSDTVIVRVLPQSTTPTSTTNTTTTTSTTTSTTTTTTTTTPTTIPPPQYPLELIVAIAGIIAVVFVALALIGIKRTLNKRSRKYYERRLGC